MNRSLNQRWLHLGLILLLLMITTWLRLWRLSDLPPGFWRDEAYNAMDALWMLESGSPQLFLVGNTGREPLYHYLSLLSMGLLGPKPYTLRLVSALIGILTIPLMYRWLRILFAEDPDRRWIGLIAAAGLTFSLWHLVMSRAGYRAGLVPPFVILISLLFWRAWQRRSLPYFVGAGIVLGLSQYTYLSARLLPLVFGLFGLIRLVVAERQPRLVRFSGQKSRGETGREIGWAWKSLIRKSSEVSLLSQQQGLWLGLLVMAAVSFIIFLPLGLFFLKNPATFISRTTDVSIFGQAARIEVAITTVLGAQLLDGLRVFFDGGQDSIWRHTLVGYPGFDWLSRIGFWFGLVAAVKRARQARYMLLLVALLVLWLPVLLSSVNTLRLSGFLVPYYTLMAIGWLVVIQGVTKLLRQPWTGLRARLIFFVLFVTFSGGLTGYNYFVRWAHEPEVFRQFRGHLVELTYDLIDQSKTHDILMPFQMYTHATTRFLLKPDFLEVDRPPSITPDRPVTLVNVPQMVDVPPYVASYAYVWLTRDASGQGLAYVLRPQQPDHLAALVPTGQSTPFYNTRNGQLFAQLTPLESVEPLLTLTERATIQPVDYDWGHQVRLVGFEVIPKDIQPGQSPVLNLYWQSMIGQPFPYTIFIQLINGQGEPLGQWTDGFLTDQHRWREGFITPTQHWLWIGPEASPGPYLVRMGLFEVRTGHRIPIYAPNGDPLGDQILLGLFYMGGDGIDPRLPQTRLEARLGDQGGDQIQLLGYTLAPAPTGGTTLQVQLYWRSERGLDRDYTIFVQLLNGQGQLVTGWDSQPLAGHYPTSYWQPNEAVVDEFELPLPDTLPPGDYQLVTGMYDFVTGRRLPATGVDGQPLPNDMIILTQTTIP